LKINTDEVIEALDELHHNTEFEGGLTEAKASADFKQIIRMSSSADDILDDLAGMIETKDVPAIRRTLQLNHVEEDVLAKFEQEVMENPYVIKLLILFGGMCLSVLIWAGWTCQRWCKVRSLRHEEEDKSNRVSKRNYWWAFFSHSRMDVNLNKKKIKDIDASLQKIEGEVAALNLRLDSMDTIIDIEKKEPPPYTGNLTELA